MKSHATRLVPCVDAIEHERMEMDVQIQRIAEELHEGDSAALENPPKPD